SPVTVWVVAVELNATGVWRVDPIHGVTTYVVIGTGAAIGCCHDTTACVLPGVTVPMVGGGSATQADSPNATNATTTTATQMRNSLSGRGIANTPHDPRFQHRTPRPKHTASPHMEMPSYRAVVWSSRHRDDDRTTKRREGYVYLFTNAIA